MTLAPRVVVVHRRTEYEELIARHGTRGQATFFARSRGGDLGEVERRHIVQHQALATVAAAIPLDWRRGSVERADLDRFAFHDGDIVVAVGQDGLIANVAKYLDEQPVIGICPDDTMGVLATHPPERLAQLLRIDIEAAVQHRVMVEANADDGQTLTAVNEIYLGHASHQSARYTLRLPDNAERQSSSGLVVGTGTGASGWCRSLWLERRSPFDLPTPTEPRLSWFVREAWPSPDTGTTHTEGLLSDTAKLAVTVESDALTAFGDGIETDAITLTWGQTVTFHRAARTLHLLT